MKYADPLLSVIILAYNQQDYIEKCLDYVVNQNTDFIFEVIIGEDCSVDNTREIIFEYKKKYPRLINVITSSENVGLIKNFIRCLNIAKGKYIAICGGDDYWFDKNKLQKQVDIFTIYQDVSLVHTNFDVFYVTNKLIEKKIIKYDHICKRETEYGVSSIVAELSGMFRPVKASTIVFIREYLVSAYQKDHNIFDDRPCEDIQICYEMGLRGRFFFIDESTTIINCIPNSLSFQSDAEKRLEFMASIFDLNLFYIKKYKIQKDVVRIYCKRAVHCILHLGLEVSNTSNIVHSVKDAVKYGYTLSFRQKVLYCCVLNKRLKIIYCFINRVRKISIL